MFYAAIFILSGVLAVIIATVFWIRMLIREGKESLAE